MTPRVVSVVNMKGGVGKSTTVASLAEALASEGDPGRAWAVVLAYLLRDPEFLTY